MLAGNQLRLRAIHLAFRQQRVVPMRLAMAMAGGLGLGGLIMLAPLAAGTPAEEPSFEAPTKRAPQKGTVRIHGKTFKLVYAVR